MSDQITALVVDDSSIIRALYKAWLEQLGASIVGEASNGHDAIKLAVEYQPDLVLLDVMMPDMNGYLALKEMITKLEHPYVIMMTTVDDQDVIDSSHTEGAQDYIVKTMEPDEIKARLKKHIDFLQLKPE